MNGQEKDDEIFEGAMTAEYWEYDSRTGRRWNLDPIDQISESNYSCFGNNPIMNTDVNGDFKTKFGAKVYAFFNGGEVFKDKGGEYGVNQSTYTETDVTIRPNAFDWSGRSVGRDLNHEAAIEWAKEEHQIDAMRRDGLWDDNITQEQGAKNAVNLGLSSMVSIPGSFVQKATSEVNLASVERTAHIIAGDKTGGGHAWFGSLKAFVNGITGAKSMFPMTWSKGKIMNAISHVLANNKWVQQTGKAGELFTKSGKDARFVIEGVFDGVKIKVVATNADIITAHPIP